jgi:hypothetical protein
VVRYHDYYWYPWYSYGFGWNLGLYAYDPWYYGPSRGVWMPYGYGYPYGGPVPQAGYWDRANGNEKSNIQEGALRIRANVRDARVYVDGALVGLVDDFDGLSGHLTVEAGRHNLELRADGYETLHRDVMVEANKTLTERFDLKKR